MRRLRLILALTITWPVTAAAQETTGGVRGRLHSPATGPVANAQITATTPDLLGERRALSAGDGVFQFGLLAPGTYTLRVTAIGNRPLVIRDVEVRLWRTTGLGDVTLEPAAVELGELTVVAPALTLDPVRTTVGATLTAEDFALLPAQRDYKSAIAILPQVNTSPHGDPVNVAGSTGLENMYFIDGMNVTAPLDATRGTSLPYNFVRAVEVKAGGYKSTGDYAAAVALFEAHGIHFDPALRDEVVARVEKLNLPSYTGFVQPELTAIRDEAGTITDVVITYPLSLEKQMLDWSA